MKKETVIISDKYPDNYNVIRGVQTGFYKNGIGVSTIKIVQNNKNKELVGIAQPYHLKSCNGLLFIVNLYDKEFDKIK